jgi:hypothetical protein
MDRTFIYALKESMDLIAPISTKTITAQWHYVKISYSEFHPNRLRNMESVGANSFSTLSKVCMSLG